MGLITLSLLKRLGTFVYFHSGSISNQVKVCDICGNAGREDLLAICSKCADGAEHM